MAENRQTSARRAAIVGASLSLLTRSWPTGSTTCAAPAWTTPVTPHAICESRSGRRAATLRLREARTGERLALIAYRPDGTAGAGREIGPVFVHADPCDGYREPYAYPEGFRPGKQVFRSHGHDGRIHDAVLVCGADAEAAIEKIFADPEIATVHSRNVLHGCYMFAIHRA